MTSVVRNANPQAVQEGRKNPEGGVAQSGAASTPDSAVSLAAGGQRLLAAGADLGDRSPDERERGRPVSDAPHLVSDSDGAVGTPWPAAPSGLVDPEPEHLDAGEIFYGSKRYEVETLSEGGESTRPVAPEREIACQPELAAPSESASDPKPEPRIVDKFALPFDSQPYLDNVCPLCKGSLDWSSKHHLIPRSQGGSDVPGNLIWVCGDGTRGCHGTLETRSKGTHGLSYNRVAIALVRYVREEVPEYGQYTDAEKYEGYVESRYLGEALNDRRPLG